MKTSELKEIAGYLPYGLEAVTIVDAREEFMHLEIDTYYIFDKGNIWTYCGYADSDLCIPLGEGEINGFILRHGNSYADMQNFVKPLLLPLSMLNQEIEVNGKKFLPIDELDFYHDFSIMRFSDIETNPTRYPYTIVEKLYEWHFDIHGLIEKGFAIDKTTLK